MDPVFVLGWVAGIVGGLSGVPQIVRLARADDSRGVSLLNWQVTLGNSISWTVHGAVLGAANIWFTNAALTVASVWVVWLLARDRRLSPVAAYATVALPVAAGGILVDHWLGPWVFGAFVTVGASIGAISQLVDIIVSPRITGVSFWYLLVMVLVQAMWSTWALITHERSIIVSGLTLLVLSVASLAWFLLRRLGVPPLKRSGGAVA